METDSNYRFQTVAEYLENRFSNFGMFPSFESWPKAQTIPPLESHFFWLI
jgi:hypothetical protein